MVGLKPAKGDTLVHALKNLGKVLSFKRAISFALHLQYWLFVVLVQAMFIYEKVLQLLILI